MTDALFIYALKDGKIVKEKCPIIKKTKNTNVIASYILFSGYKKELTVKASELGLFVKKYPSRVILDKDDDTLAKQTIENFCNGMIKSLKEEIENVKVVKGWNITDITEAEIRG